MEQLLLHLIGDYVTQSNWMAVNKTRSWYPAFLHAVIYSTPFIFLGGPWAVVMICATHYLIDRYRLARYLVFAKNWLLCPPEESPTWLGSQSTGYPTDAPIWLAMWLTIIADNVMHLSINYAALRWL